MDNLNNNNKDKVVNTDERKTEEKTLLQDIISLLVKIVIVAAVFVVIFSFIFAAFRYADLSMTPSIKDGDLILSYRWDKKYEAGDIAAFSYDDEMTCSRVVAVAGDKVNIDKDGLTVNGSHIQDDNAYGVTTQVEGGVTFPLTVSDNNIFVLGDNRKAATDSRIIGCVDVDKTQGKVIGIFRHRGL